MPLTVEVPRPFSFQFPSFHHSITPPLHSCAPRPMTDHDNFKNYGEQLAFTEFEYRTGVFDKVTETGFPF